MPKSTENFNLLYAAEGEIITPDIEENRYLTIDRQLLGLFEIFGNGVIEGWNVSSGDGLIAIITSGRGIVDLKYLESNVANSLVNLPAESTLYLYVDKLAISNIDIEPNFYVAPILEDRDEALLLAVITTGPTSITNIDESVRTNISFVEAALEIVRNHRHFGGDNPTQIDLASEVRGELPAINISDIDASKITTGRLGESAIPQLSHFDLEDIGTLTHAQIDSFIRMLTFENSHLLGEVASTNLMQLFLSHKHFWHNVDEFAHNLLLLIPGISPDSFTDFNATTAEFDKVNHVIKGLKATAGTVLNKNISSNADFAGYHSASNIEIKNNSIRIQKDEAEEKIIDDFEGVTQNGQTIPGFTKATTITSDSSGLTSTVDNKNSGFFGGEVSVNQVVRLSFTKSFSPFEDWSLYSTFSIKIKNTSLNHGQINMYFVNVDSSGSEVVQSPIILLSENEVTDGFKTVTVDLSAYSVDQVSQLVIYTDTSIGWNVSEPFSFTLDDIIVRRESLFKTQANVRYRVNLPQIAQWDAVSWNFTSNGGNVQVRARSAAAPSVLNSTPFAEYIANSGDSPDVADNTDLELDITLTPNSTRDESPVLDLVRLTYIVSASNEGFIVDSLDDWDNGTPSSKADINTTPGSLRIGEPISVGDIYYGNEIIFSQIDNNDIPVFGYRGNEAPPSPHQLIVNNINTGYDLIYSLQRLDGGNYVFCDSGSSRIIETNPEGNFIFGMGSFEGRADSLTVLTSVYRAEEGLLTLVMSKGTSVGDINFSRIEIKTDTETIVLGNAESVVQDFLIDSTGVSSVFNIQLSSDNQFLIGDKTDLKLIIREGAFTESLSDVFLTTKSLRVDGLPIFVGNFIYTQGISDPISVDKLENGNYLIGNAKRWGRTNLGVATVIEMNTSGTTSFTFDEKDFTFTYETLGRAEEFDRDFFLMVGMVGVASSVISDSQPIIEVKPNAGDNTITDYTINTGAVFKLIGDAFVAPEGGGSGNREVLGTRFTWSSNNSSVASVDAFGVVTANSTGTAVITATTTSTTGIVDDPVSGTVNIQVVEGEQNPSISTAEFSSTEEDIAQNAAGRTFLVDRVSKNIVFDYESVEGLFPASVSRDENGQFVIAEKSLLTGKTSRVIKIDSSGNVIFEFGFGQIDSPNDVKALVNEEIIISS
jgi:hypothetical protein